MNSMTCLCIALGAWSLGLFTAFFLYGWFEHTSDAYAGIPWSTTLETCIHWEAQQAPASPYPIIAKGPLDWMARERWTKRSRTWIQTHTYTLRGDITQWYQTTYECRSRYPYPQRAWRPPQS